MNDIGVCLLSTLETKSEEYHHIACVLFTFFAWSIQVPVCVREWALREELMFAKHYLSLCKSNLEKES